MMTLIETITVGSGGAASIEFTGIPQDGKDLMVLCSARTSDSASTDILTLSLNGSTSNFQLVRLYGTGSAAGAQSNSNNWAGIISAADNTNSTFASVQIYLSNYNTANNKSYSADSVLENNATFGWTQIQAGNWANSDSITSLLLSASSSSNFIQHSTASLYIIS